MTIEYPVEQKVPKAFPKVQPKGKTALINYPIATVDQVIEKTLKYSAEAKEDPYVFDKPIKRVAVIGAGAAGLPTAKALKEQGMEVRIFERMEDVGGIWLYSEEIDEKPRIPCDTYRTREKPSPQEETIVEATKQEKLNKRKHAPPSACYPDLHNNTAAPLMMDFQDFPWPEGTSWYVPHNEVQHYFKNYVKHFGLYDIMELNTSVDYVERNNDKNRGHPWTLTLRKAEYMEDRTKIRYKTWTESFDAVAVASGAYNDPFLPDFKDLQQYNINYPEKILHSKQYRHYQDYIGKNVLIVGGNISAIEIAQRLDGIANNVYMSMRGPFESISNILNLARSVLPDDTIRKPNIRSFSDAKGEVNGSITFEDDSVIGHIDQVIFCTGYVNDLGFLGPLRAYGTTDPDADKEEEEIEGPLVITNGMRPINTYRDIFAIRDPTLAFVGTPGHLTSVQLFYYQAQAVARVWAGLAWLPSRSKMRQFLKTYMYPFPPFDMNLLGCLLFSQPFVTWLNEHAKYHDDKHIETIKSVDPALLDLWDEIKEQYKKRTAEILAKRDTLPTIKTSP
ncbi:hypothetical protein BDA99DRAFT_157531 [Phascolomyces articulosus]|uniref:Flavin-containing monooxygenase n=1 Tax=Phascolomyces articulosus TaxID=60185 RepID=A0AAD5K469_9FUNG|nr:hypothetical protein BDA99DRAFT_157531 [Phascolomyces articulosus]